MSGKYQIFYPGEYLDFEKSCVEERMKNRLRRNNAPPPPFKMEPRPISEEEILAYNRKWNPYDPLYNAPEYARAHGHKSVPAYPGFMAMAPMGIPGFPKDIADLFYYTNDGTDIRYYRNVYAGDMLIPANEKLEFKDLTAPGSDLRMWYIGGEADCVDQNGELVWHVKGNVRDAYRKIIDGSPAPSFREHMASWTEYFPPAHYTTDEDYEYIKSIWDQEVINGDNTPAGKIPIGFELPRPAPTLRNLHAHDILARHRQPVHLHPRARIPRCGRPPSATVSARSWTDGAPLCGRNIPGFRAVWYNDTGAKLIACTLPTSWAQGQDIPLLWRFCPFFKKCAFLSARTCSTRCPAWRAGTATATARKETPASAARL